MKKLLALLLAAAMCCAMLAACGQDNAADNDGDDTTTEVDLSTLTFAVEAGSAGEAIAQEKGWTTNSVAAQSDTLMEVSAGTSDAAIIDLLMAGAMIGEALTIPT